MQFHQLPNITHLFILRQFQPGENLWHHASTHYFMTMKCPAMALFKSLGGGFADIMQNCGPSKPEVLGVNGNIIQHLEGMVKIVFMAFAINIFCASKVHHLWK